MTGLPAAGRLLLARELRVHLRTFLFWVIPVALLLVMVSSLHPSMAGANSMLAAKLETLPEGLRRAFGLEKVDLRSPAAYLAVNFVYVTLTAALIGALLGATVIAREESQRTAEILYAQPVRRTRVLLGKATAAAIYTLAFDVVLAIVAIAALSGFSNRPVEIELIASMFAGTAALGVCFAGVGLLVATVVRRARAAGNVAMGVAMGAYLLAVATASSPRAEAIGQLSPFRHVEPARIIAAGGVSVTAVAVLVAIGLGCAAVAIARYARRDLPG